MDKQAFLNAHKSKVKKLEIDGQEIYLREITIQDNNFLMFEREAYLLSRAKQLGIEIDLSDRKLMEIQLAQVTDPYVLARNVAIRVCDEQGNLLFNPTDNDDLEQINGLSESLLLLLSDEINKKKS